MKMVQVDGLPIRKLKDLYLVLILESEKDIEELILASSDIHPLFFDDEKAFLINGKNCHVFFHSGKIQEWVKKYG